MSKFGCPEYLQKLWVLDIMNSPCIDAGDPRTDPMGELITGGGRVNMGAYGNTIYASKSQWLLGGDADRNGAVNLADFTCIAANWLLVAPWLE